MTAADSNPAINIDDMVTADEIVDHYPALGRWQAHVDRWRVPALLPLGSA
jgi:hypothetical protein